MTASVALSRDSELGLAPGRAVIVGLGQTGLSVARYLAKNGWSLSVVEARKEAQSSAQLVTIDPHAEQYLDESQIDQAGSATALSSEIKALLDRSQLVVASPGVPLSHALLRQARESRLPIMGDIEIFARVKQARSLPAEVVGITGTNGKSTVTALLGDMAARAGIRVAVGGNIGTPVLDLLADTTTELFVLELSSFQLDTTASLAPRVAAVLNVAEDHLDRYGDIANYAASKARIFNRATTAVMNADDPRVMAMRHTGARSVSRQVLFSLRNEADYCLQTHAGEDWLVARREPVLAVRDMRLLGRHNVANALAAFAMADELGVSREAILASLREFSGLPHRMEWIAEYAGVRYINDSKGTNVGATIAAVAGLTGPFLLIAGGDGKGQDFAPLAEALHGKAKHVLLIGRDASKIATALGSSVQCTRVADLEGAVCEASRLATAGDTVLLSPACSSLDMFRNYLHRGDVFRQRVQELQP